MFEKKPETAITSTFYWNKGGPVQNFGDFLSEYLTQYLFFGYRSSSRGVHLVGSVVDDMFVPLTGDDRPVLFWGCGAREPDGLSRDRMQHAQFFSVRGPLTASALGLGTLIPKGDPGFIMPALYAPRKLEWLAGKSICVPHFHDARDDSTILAASGCDFVVRPSIQNNEKALTDVIDAIFSADFVLASAMHGCIVAAAYHRPFAFWSADTIDLPFKWQDLAASLCIPSDFVSNLTEAKRHYEQAILPSLQLPNMLKSILRSPLLVRASGLMKVLRWYGRQGDHQTSLEEEREIACFAAQQQAIFDEILSEIVDGRHRASSLIKEVEDGRQRASLLINEVEDGRHRASSLINEVEDGRQRASLLVEEVRRNTDAYAALTSRYHHKEQELAAAKNDLGNSTKELAAIKNDLGNSTKEFARLKQTLSRQEIDARQQIAELKNEVQRGRNLVCYLRKQGVRNEVLTQAIPFHIRLKENLRSAAYRSVSRGARDVLRANIFDPLWYLTNNSDVADARVNAEDHFIRFGFAERRSPHPLFLSDWYLQEYPEVAERGDIPIDHYLKHGDKGGLKPNPFFDPAWYRNQYADALGSSLPALVHYIRYGESQGRKPSPYFDPALYLDANPDVATAELSPLLHYIELGRIEGRSPCNLFDIVWYVQTYGLESSFDAFEHYLRVGEKAGYRPNPYFDPTWYLTQNPDVAAASLSPLMHYLQSGEKEGRKPNPYFDPAWYLTQNPDVAAACLSPLMHYLQSGEKEGRKPSPCFDPTWYLTQNPDVAAASLSPLMHYLQSGEQEGRKPSPYFDPTSYLTQNPDVAAACLSPRSQVPRSDDQKRVLIIDSVYPTPDRDSGSVDAMNFVRIFSKLGYAVYFAATANFNSKELDRTARHAKIQLEDLGVLVLDDSHAPNIAELIRLNGGLFELFFLSRVDAGGNFFETIRAHCPVAKIIFNTVDIHFSRELREGHLEKNRVKINAAFGTRERELYLVRLTDATIVVSEAEVRLLDQEVPGSIVHEVPLIREIPGRKADFSNRNGIGFIGGYRHTPNLDAVKYFLDNVWPLVRKQLPDVPFHLMGADMPEELLQRKDPGLIVVGHVANLQDAFEKLRLTVAPLRYGAGAKGKVISSLSHGVPCVCTPVAAEGMGVREAGAVLVAETDQDFANDIFRAYTDQTVWQEISDRGLKLALDRHDFNAGVDRIKTIVRDIGLLNSHQF